MKKDRERKRERKREREREREREKRKETFGNRKSGGKTKREKTVRVNESSRLHWCSQGQLTRGPLWLKLCTFSVRFVNAFSEFVGKYLPAHVKTSFVLFFFLSLIYCVFPLPLPLPHSHPRGKCRCKWKAPFS